MPQMMPLNWLMLFSFFSMLLIIFNITNYYNSLNEFTPYINKKMLTKTPLNWKW
uniref:ATP synthase complex subunit 8 n=1 Tax=Phyllothelys breve TaxID=2841941 RepID=A0A8F0FE57_9NEOP|nr:ATP synthase F0 subunit 8 [Phyllothelys breve]